MARPDRSSSRRHLIKVLGATAAAWALGRSYAQRRPANEGPAQLRIGYQKSAVNLVILKQEGALESSRSTSRRRTRAPPSSGAASMRGRSGTRSTQPPNSR